MSNLPPGCTDRQIEGQCREPTRPCEKCGCGPDDHDWSVATYTVDPPCLSCDECSGYQESDPEPPDYMIEPDDDERRYLRGGA